ncbi:hypothetical protein [Acinetobacter nosocomialis]|uniref:hypothetical protein n=1 Tax=Acinetobacter nosocomialis TaxID=106654 RepID=UPI001B830F2E|nr:hypothetical protein [Acinetobacter nosocomialis]
MIYKLKMWISAEVVDPFFSLYSYIYKKFVLVLVLTLSFCLIVILCALNPSIVFTPKKEGFVVYEPEFHIKHGRMTSLIIKKGNKKFLINCAYFKNENGSFCELYRPRRLLKLEGSFFPYPSIFLAGNKIVASSVRFEDEKGSVINFSTSEEKIASWWNWVMFPTLLMRYLILIWLVVVVLILLLKAFKYQYKS